MAPGLRQMQRDIFAQGEGAAWLARNQSLLGKRDPVMDALAHWRIDPKSVLDVGCANGWRVERLIDRYKCKAFGIDPAVPEPPISRLEEPSFKHLRHGHAGALYHYSNGQFDLVIYGFCLYLCDPSDYPAIVKEGDRVLADGGHIVIHDFAVLDDEIPWRTPYKHKDGVYSHHFPFEALWLASPQYKKNAFLIPAGWHEFHDHVVCLRKDVSTAFEERSTHSCGG